MKLSRRAPAAFLLFGAALAAAPLAAQQPATGYSALGVSAQERPALLVLQAAASGYDRAAQDAALAAARTVLATPHGRYAFAHAQLQIGQGRQDSAMVGQAVDILVESGLAPATELPALISNQVARAYYGGDFRRADRLLGQMIQLQPTNPVFLADYGQLKARLGDRAQAVALLQRAIQAGQASGQPVPESWRLRALALAVEARLAPQSILLARELVAVSPTPLNWRDSLLVYRQSGAVDPALDLDILRLMRAASALAGERDYLDLAGKLAEAGFHGEAKAVLDEGVARSMLDAREAAVRQAIAASTRRVAAEQSGLARLRTQALAGAEAAPVIAAADAHLGHREWAGATELYRAALQKAGGDPNLINSRLGMALALAGQRTEAEAAFRAVTGPRADLAAFWLTWLAGRAG